MNANLEYNLNKEQKCRMEQFEIIDAKKSEYRKNENKNIDACDVSGYSMFAVAGSILLGIGIVVYGLITAII